LTAIGARTSARGRLASCVASDSIFFARTYVRLPPLIYSFWAQILGCSIPKELLMHVLRG
jgi:hypothetical protein